jgi:integrase
VILTLGLPPHVHAGAALPTVRQSARIAGKRSLSQTRARHVIAFDEWSCQLCGSHAEEDKMLLCDGCDQGFHTFCLSPPLLTVPRGKWFCSECTPVRVPALPTEQPVLSAAHGACPVCLGTTLHRTVVCRGCAAAFHATCLGLHASAFPAGEFVCADCSLVACKVVHPTLQATQAAHMLVYLSANRVATSSMDTYASAMHRFVRFAINDCNLPRHIVLPPGPDGVVSTELVRLFLAHAATKYKVSTIKVTLAALVDWHKSKGAPHVSVSPANPSLKPLLQALQRTQGPAGLPSGKEGMSRDVLLMLLRYLWELRKTEPDFSHLHLRDWVAVALGFFGLLRRSELIALQLRDITVNSVSTPPHIAVHIRRSKADQLGAGACVVVTAVTKDNIHIASRVEELLAIRTQCGAQATDPLLAAWDLDSRTLHRSTPLQNGQALAVRLQRHLTDLVQRYPGAVRVNPRSYGMHSLRRGGGCGCLESGSRCGKAQSPRALGERCRACIHDPGCRAEAIRVWEHVT